MKRNVLTKLLIVLPIIFLTLVMLVAAAPRANPRKGKVYFKKFCRTCHDGSTEQATLTPMTKTIEQWSRDFENGGQVAQCLPRVHTQAGMELTPRDLVDIQSYLVQHAADSDQPATCGN